MKNKAKKTTILAIGDKGDFDSFEKFNKERVRIKRHGFEYKPVTYKHVLAGKVDVETDNVIIIPFFPFKHWNKNIEHKKYRGLYGNLTFRDKFLKFSKTFDIKIDKLLDGKTYSFINNLQDCAMYRDKKTVMRKLRANGVSVPVNFGIKSVKSLKKKLLSGDKFYIKPRCGSMGKGITYLEEGNWQTNFRVRKNTILNRRSDYGWKFKDITDNDVFLEKLIKKDVLIEEAIDSMEFGRNKADFRAYVFLGEVLYVYPKMNTADSVTTNISQGGKGRPSLLRKLPEPLLNKIKRECTKTAKILGLGFVGVDVIVDKNKKDIYIIDINMFPGFPKRNTFNLAKSAVDVLARSTKNPLTPFRGSR